MVDWGSNTSVLLFWSNVAVAAWGTTIDQILGCVDRLQPEVCRCLTCESHTSCSLEEFCSYAPQHLFGAVCKLEFFREQCRYWCSMLRTPSMWTPPSVRPDDFGSIICCILDHGSKNFELLISPSRNMSTFSLNDHQWMSWKTLILIRIASALTLRDPNVWFWFSAWLDLLISLECWPSCASLPCSVNMVSHGLEVEEALLPLLTSPVGYWS